MTSLPTCPGAFRASWVYDDLYKVRNVKPGLEWGALAGTLHGGIHMWLNDLHLGALVGWTLHHGKPDHECLKPAAEMPKIDYPKYDGVLTFDKLSSVFVSNTNHEENQPSHLQLRDPAVPVAVNLADLRRARTAVLPGGSVRIRRRRSQRAAPATAADQRAELRALQDLRHQGSAPEHPLGHAGRRRRAELLQHVIDATGSSTTTRRRARRSNRRADAARAACRRAPRTPNGPNAPAH